MSQVSQVKRYQVFRAKVTKRYPDADGSGMILIPRNTKVTVAAEGVGEGGSYSRVCWGVLPNYGTAFVPTGDLINQDFFVYVSG